MVRHVALRAVLVGCAVCSVWTVPASPSDEKPLATREHDAPAPAEDSRYSYREDHDRHGIGKFYMEREIAHVVGAGAVTWLERPKREEEENLSLLVESLGLKPGMVVADIGAGSGVISIRMAKRIMPGGKVVAVDIQREMLDVLDTKAKQLGIKNIELVKGATKSPNLQPNSVDLAIMVDVYHEFEFPYEMMRDIAKAMRPGGRIAFVEYRLEDPDVPMLLVHKMTEQQVKQEMSLPEFGLTWKETIDVLPWQHIVVFERGKEKGSGSEN